MSKRIVPRASTPRARRLARHASGRSITRYGLAEHEVNAIRKRVQRFFDNSCRPDAEYSVTVVKNQSKNRSMVAIRHNERWIALVYHKRLQTLVTFLPESVLEDFVPPHAKEPVLDTRSDIDRWLAGENLE